MRSLCVAKRQLRSARLARGAQPLKLRASYSYPIKNRGSTKYQSKIFSPSLSAFGSFSVTVLHGPNGSHHPPDFGTQHIPSVLTVGRTLA